MVEFSEEGRRSLNSGQAVEIVDSETAQAVVLRKDIYDRLLGRVTIPAT